MLLSQFGKFLAIPLRGPLEQGHWLGLLPEPSGHGQAHTDNMRLTPEGMLADRTRELCDHFLVT